MFVLENATVCRQVKQRLEQVLLKFVVLEQVFFEQKSRRQRLGSVRGRGGEDNSDTMTAFDNHSCRCGQVRSDCQSRKVHKDYLHGQFHRQAG
jgi:hypothetical protein